MYSKCGCISKNKYDDYFQNHDVAFGIEISKFDSYIHPLDPLSIDSKFRAPQSFCYIDNVEFIKFLYAHYDE